MTSHGLPHQVKSIQSAFLRGKNRDLLRAWDAAAYERCISARSLTELMDAHAPFAMRDHTATSIEYYAAHSPMADRGGVAVPTLLLNAEDDFVCPASLARPDLIVAEQPGALLLVTRRGSHVAFNEGWLARGAFHLRISFDYLDAAFALARRDGGHQRSRGTSRGVVVPTGGFRTALVGAKDDRTQEQSNGMQHATWGVGVSE